MIIAAFARTGKSTLAKNHADEFIDFVCMPYKYELADADGSEAGNANPDNILRGDWPYNYVEVIIVNMDCGKHLIIPSDSFVLSLLRMKSIPYILCYPRREAKEEYLRRFIERGNTQDFLDIFIGGWDRFMNSLEEEDYRKRLILESTAY